MQAQRRASVTQQVLLAGAIALAGALATAAGSPAAAQQVLAVVNGVPITSYDVDQRTRLSQISGGKVPSRKEVLDDLIDDRVKLSEAKRWSVEVPNSEVESSYAAMASRMGMKPEQLTQALTGRGVNPETLKLRIRADIAWGNLVRGRYQASLQIGDGDLHAALGAAAEDESAVGHVYTLRPILFIVPQGSPPAAFEARRREADALRNRVSGCEEGVRFARELRDVAVRDQIIRSSANLPAPLRTMLNSLEIGKLTAPEITAQGVELFALCGKEVTRAETPRRQETRQGLFAKRYEEQSKRYLARVRSSAMIEYK